MSIAQDAAKKGIRYFLISFTDMFGVMRSKLVPVSAMDDMAKNGAGFAGFATYLDMTPADSDLFAVPDMDTMIQLPWNKEVAWVSSDLMMDGKKVAHSPRQVLKDVRAKSDYVLKTGVECEFFLLNFEGNALADDADTQAKPCYDQIALMRRYDLISRLCDIMNDLGWEPYQNDHEDGNGQFEMNWGYADCLVTADRQAFFKFMVRTLAEEYGMRATFMPKPLSNLTGNGCHMHFSLWDSTGTKNVFIDNKGELGLSEKAYHFLGGVLAEATSLCAITNPTVNSYKRINAGETVSGASWSPNTVSYTGNNRTHMVRIPEANRFELRLPDGAANPYLMPASVLASGLAGMERKADPGKRLDNNMYTNPPAKVKKLPNTLHAALMNLQGNKVLREQMGDEFIDAYVKLKLREWTQYNRHISAWERQTYLDC